MRGTMLYAPSDIRVEERAKPAIQEPADAIIRICAACVCGSDLWPYRGIEPIEGPVPMGHEYAGVVEETGRDVRTLEPVGVVRHGYSHFTVELELFRARLPADADMSHGLGPTQRWVTAEEFARLPRPRATVKACRLLWRQTSSICELAGRPVNGNRSGCGSKMRQVLVRPNNESRNSKSMGSTRRSYSRRCWPDRPSGAESRTTNSTAQWSTLITNGSLKTTARSHPAG